MQQIASVELEAARLRLEFTKERFQSGTVNSAAYSTANLAYDEALKNYRKVAL